MMILSKNHMVYKEIKFLALQKEQIFHFFQTFLLLNFNHPCIHLQISLIFQHNLYFCNSIIIKNPKNLFNFDFNLYSL